MPRVAALAGLALVACSSSPTESSSLSGASNGDSGSSGSSSTAADTTSGTTGDPGDPAYPRPQPVEATGTCPDGTFGPITFEGSAWICIPPCDGTMCPAAATGTAEAACATNPDSSNTACTSSADCTIADEFCGNAGDHMACLLPPSHCILRCDADKICPDEMTCTLASVCAYLP